jgi:hypothetical protein
MPSYAYVVLYPPESADDLESRLAGSGWRRIAHDPNSRAVALTGTFEDEEAASAEIHEAFPGLESESGLRLDPQAVAEGIAAPSDFTGQIIDGVMSSVKPVERGGSPIGIPGDVPKDPNQQPPPSSDKDQKAEPAAADDKPKVTAPEVGPGAQNIAAGLEAIGVPLELWKTLPYSERKALAKTVLTDLYKERSAYGRSVRWTFASDAELLALAPDDVSRSTLAVDLLKVRAGIADHQLEAAKKQVELQKESVEYAEENVKLRKKAVQQQDVVTDILKELLAQFERWRLFSWFGVAFLAVGFVFSMALIFWLIKLLRDGKITDWWLLPTAIFGLAIFVISPAVLLLRERPLKGLDEAGWPGVSSPATSSAAAGAAPAATAPAGTAPAATAPAATTPAATTAAATPSATTTTTTFVAQRPG